MIAPDVDVVVSALRSDAPDHGAMKDWMENAIHGPEPLVLTPAVLTGAVRVLTHPRVFSPPTPVAWVVEALSATLGHPGVQMLGPGPRHWSILADLCTTTAARGNVVADAGHAATAIEHGLTWVSKDRDFARFPGLRWQVPG